MTRSPENLYSLTANLENFLKMKMHVLENAKEVSKHGTGASHIQVYFYSL